MVPVSNWRQEGCMYIVRKLGMATSEYSTTCTSTHDVHDVLAHHHFRLGPVRSGCKHVVRFA